MCDICAAGIREGRKRREALRVASGLCPECGMPAQPDHRLCFSCAVKAAKRSAALRARRRENGLCSVCGKAPPEPGRTMCEACRAYYRRRHAEACARQKAVRP